MPKHPLSDTSTQHRSAHNGGASDVTVDLRSRLLRVSLIPAIVVALLGAVAATLLIADPSSVNRYTAVAIGVGGCLIVLFGSIKSVNTTVRAVQEQADAVGRDTQQWIMGLRASTVQGTDELQRLVHKVRNGDNPPLRGPVEEPPYGSHPFAFLAYDMQRGQWAAEDAVVQAAKLAFGDGPDQRVAVFVNVGRRLQSLVHRAIQKLDELERQVEDPDLLKGLFNVDNVTTRVRRHAESLAVLGGAVSRRQWSKPVDMYTVLRSAVAEVEHYARVKVVQPIEGTLRGHAIIDIIHLVAELVENATTFSAPDTQVIVHAQRVTAGLAIEVQDRGLGMSSDDQQRMNNLLSNPSKTDLGSLLQDGRIGLYVVAELGRRHGVKVRLQNNIFGGIDALIVVPKGLLGDEQPEEPNPRTLSAPQEPIAAGSTTVRPAATATPGRSVVLAPFAPGEPPVADQQPVPGPADNIGAPYQPSRAPLGEVAAMPNGHNSGLPMRRPSMQRPDAAPPARLRDGVAQGGNGHDARPPLPKRDRGGYMVPELRNGPAAPKTEPAAGPNTSLMAAFQRGVNRSSAEENGSTGHSDRTS